MIIRTQVNISSVRLLGADFNEADLNRAVNTPARNRLVLETYKKHAAKRKAVVFTAGVEHAKELARVFNDGGVSADWVAGADRNTPAKLERFSQGAFRAVMNAQLLTEGWDEASVDAAFICRPVRSRAMLTQMIGRALRVHHAKTDALIVHFFDRTAVPLSSVWDIVGDPDKMGFGGKTSHAETQNDGMEDIERLADRFAWLFNRRLVIDGVPEAIACLAPPPEQQTVDYGNYRWSNEAPTDKQLQLLRSYGYNVDNEVWTKGTAAETIDRIPATPAQLRFLLAHGFDVLRQDWTRQQASRALTEVRTAPDWNRVTQIRQTLCAKDSMRKDRA
jgi:hypothetical protein